jgi:hypothetical protein
MPAYFGKLQGDPASATPDAAASGADKPKA